VRLVGVFERHLRECTERKISKFWMLHFLLSTACFGHSLDHQRVEKLQVQKGGKNLFICTLVISAWWRSNGWPKHVVGRNIRDVQKLKYCYCTDWTVNDLSIFIWYKDVTFDSYRSFFSTLFIALVSLTFYLFLYIRR